MSAALGTIGILAILIAGVMLVVSVLRKKRLRIWGIIAGVGLVLFITGMALPSSTTTPPPPPAETTEPVSPPPAPAPMPAPAPEPEPAPAPEEVSYNIVEQEDLSFSTTVRIGVRLTMNADVTQQEIEWITQDVVSNITKQQDVNAISIFMYYSGDDYFGVARVAVDWAPYGDWSRAADVTTGNYQYHQYSYNYY